MPVIFLSQPSMNPYLAERAGCILAGGGIAWAVYVATEHADLSEFFLETGFRKIFLQSGPMEVCALGIVLWLWGKWKRSVRAR